jgi:hypothetical protein
MLGFRLPAVAHSGVTCRSDYFVVFHFESTLLICEERVVNVFTLMKQLIPLNQKIVPWKFRSGFNEPNLVSCWGVHTWIIQDFK